MTGQLAPREVAEAPAGDTGSLPGLAGRACVLNLSQRTRRPLSVSVHCAQIVLRSPRPPLLGRRSQPSLEVLVPAPCRLAASCPPSLETQNLPGAAEGERISCRSPVPSLLLTSPALGCAGADLRAPGLGRPSSADVALVETSRDHCWFICQCRRPDRKMPSFPRQSQFAENFKGG